jgi:hypothetical protein
MSEKKEDGPKNKGVEDKDKTWDDKMREKQGGRLSTMDLTFKPL